MLYLVLFRKSFRRMLAYRTATLAGLATNLFFGLLRAFVFLALFAASPGERVAGYSLREALTYAGLAQAMIGPIRMWGAYEIMDSIRTGQIAIDLCKPFDYLGFWLARDLGRAAWELLARGLPLLLLYGLIFDMIWPRSPGHWLAFASALILAVLVSFHWQLLINLAAFWMTDASGLARIAFLGILLFTGIVMPLSFFPDWLAGPARWLPFAAYVNTPAEVFLGHAQGNGLWWALGHQLAWLLALAALARWVFGRGLRRLSIQGG
jgi:ABC-2 type transport system permease protein